MTIKMAPLVLASVLIFPGSAGAVQTSLLLELGAGGGDLERRVILYDCGAEAPLEVTYLNAAPNFLAVVPLEDEPEPLIFSAVLSGSGVRYAAGHWLWMTQGSDASLLDVTLDEDAEPVLSCEEISNTP